MHIGKKSRLIIILGLLSAIGPFSIDMYLPAFPDISRSLDTSVARVMLSLSSFFLGISIGQLVYGPLLERYGRKKPLYVGLSIYMLASLGCALSRSVEALIALRLLQALGGCAGMVAARAIIRDVFELKDIARVFSSIMLVVAVSPMIAPTLGGYMTAHLGWRSVFVTLSVLDLAILLAVIFFLQESRPPDRAFSLAPRRILSNFKGVLVHPQFLTFALTGAISNAGLYAYITGSPQVFMELHHVSGKTYGWIFASLAAGLIGASQLNNMALHNHDNTRIIRFALVTQSLAGTSLALLAFFGWDNIVMTLLLIFIFLCCQGFIFPNASALSLAPFGHTAGTASALMGAVQMGFGALVSSLVSLLQNHTSLPMSATMMGTATTALMILTLGNRRILKDSNAETVLEEEVEMLNTL
jgi:DHA1 family bicyclomycin/chloramphenicol resistance-like MFS transporter